MMLSIIIPIISLLLIFVVSNIKSISEKVKLGINLTILILSISSIIYQYYLQKESEKQAAYNSILTPQEQNNKYSDLKKINIKIGRTEYEMENPNLKEGQEIKPLSRILANFDYPITFKIKNNQLLISALIKNFDSKSAMEIIDNEWIVKENNVFDRNYNESALEIIDDKYNIPIFRMEMLNKNYYKITGVFIDQNQAFIVKDSNWVMLSDFKESEVVKNCNDMKRFFKYPSKSHLGEVNN